MSDLLISNVVKVYPNMIQITVYHNSYNLQKSELSKPKKLTKNEKNQINIDRSVRRTKTYITDLILCNKFDLWCTFTFNPKKVDRYNDTLVKRKMSLWLHRQKEHSPKMQYLIVAERHKDGAIHFHALVSNFNGRLKDSGRKTSRGQTIFNITGYRSGFTEAVKIETTDGDMGRLGNYIAKYITKDTPIIFAKKRYWCSQGLVRPEKYTNGVGMFKLWDLLKTTKPAYMTLEYEMFKLPYKSVFKNLDNRTSLLDVDNYTSPKIETKQIDSPLFNH